jgi:hypothetical protein
MLMAIGLVYWIMVMLFRVLLVPAVILCALPRVVIGAFVAVAVTGREFDLFALIGLLMLSDIVVINAIVLRDLAVDTITIVLLDPAQHKIEAGADVHMLADHGQPGHGSDHWRTNVTVSLPRSTSHVLRPAANQAFACPRPSFPHQALKLRAAEGNGRPIIRSTCANVYVTALAVSPARWSNNGRYADPGFGGGGGGGGGGCTGIHSFLKRSLRCTTSADCGADTAASSRSMSSRVRYVSSAEKRS